MLNYHQYFNIMNNPQIYLLKYCQIVSNIDELYHIHQYSYQNIAELTLIYFNITNLSTNILAKILLNCIIFLLKYYCIAINILIYIQIFKYYKYIHKIYLPKCFIFINILTEILLNCNIFIDILIYIEIFKYYKYIHKYTCQNIAELYHIHQYTC